MNKLMKIYWRQLGGHIHCRVFTGHEGMTFSNCGSLVFDEAEWPTIRDKLSRAATMVQE